MMFEAWVRQYIQRHPVKSAGQEEDKALFTSQVMERVREVPQPVAARQFVNAAWLPRLARPRLTFAFAAVAAGLLVAFVGLRSATHERLAKDIVARAAVLAAFSDGEPLLDNDAEALADEVDAGEQLMMLAGDQPSSDDATWIEQMSQVLDQLDEGPSGAAASAPDSSDTNWQDELDTLDDAELSASS